MILDRIAEVSRERVQEEKRRRPLFEVRRQAEERLLRERAMKGRAAGGGGRFMEALRRPGLSFICEVKKASPSKGLISPDFPYLRIAADYEAAGADAVSVLTEPEFFLGRDSYLEEIREASALPILRKDFVVDAYQVCQAKAMGASALLLIAAILEEGQMKEYISLASELGLDVLAEAHTEAEVLAADRAGARILGVNNRDLRTFQVDFSNALRLKGLVRPGVLFVAESGVRGTEDVRLLARAGADAVLVGEALMRAKDRRGLLRAMREAADGV